MFKGLVNLVANADINDSHDLIRVMVYWDKQTNGTVALTNDILEEGLALAENSFRNLSNNKRFTVLMDKRFIMNPAVYSSLQDLTNTTIKNLEYYINCNIPIEFDAITGTIGNIKSNNIGILVASHGGVTQIEGTYRIRYYG